VDAGRTRNLAVGLRCTCSQMSKVLLIGVLASVVVPDAYAKSCVRISVAPIRPASQRPVEIRLTTWLPSWAGGKFRLVEHLEMSPDSRLRMTISPPPRSPFRRSLQLQLRQEPERRWIWSARFAFPGAGAWTLTPDERLWANAPTGCAQPRRVLVRKRNRSAP
jgi:hypothetical protein